MYPLRYTSAVAASLIELFRETFRGRHDAIGLEWNGTTFTFGELDARANRMARTLAGRGLERGDRLALYLANCVEFIDLYLACTRLGAVCVPINVLYREREIDHILRDAEPRAIVATTAPPTTAPVTVWPLGGLMADVAKQRGSDLAGDPGIDSRTPAALIYTSGTTGAAKGAVLTAGNFAANALRLASAWRITAADRLLLALPLFHVHGLANGLHCSLATGARMRLLERFDHTTAAAQLEGFQPTLFFGVPSMYVRLLDLPVAAASEIGRGMRLFVSGSAPLPAHVFEAFRDRFGHEILERYGMTETLMTIGNPYEGPRRPGTIGVPLPGVSVRLLDDEGRDVLGRATGELYVKSDAVSPGYWRRPEADAASFIDGYFRTGDLATRGADGWYTLNGRRSELIISGGFNIYPREVEELLAEQPGVREAAVVGVPDRVRGEVPVAYIVPSTPGGVDAALIEAVCRQKLASFKVPRAFRVMERLPRTALGKVQRHLLAGLPDNPE